MVRTAATKDFQFVAGNLALDFVNTVGNRLAQPREYLDGVADLRRWLRLAGVGDARGLELSQGDVVRLRALREELYAALVPVARGERPDGVARVLNRQLPSLLALRALRRANARYSWAWTPASGTRRIDGEILLSAAELVRLGEYRRVSRCEDESCGWLFVDRSRAAKRRWCSMRDCGNRAKARRHYRST
jgi:predicted RNA-binding Zn ribbon-like protein